VSQTEEYLDSQELQEAGQAGAFAIKSISST